MKAKSLLIASLVEVSPRLAALAIAVAAAWVTQPVFGVPDHQLVFTENSSSSLSVTYDGSTAGITVVGGGDVWSVTFLQGIVAAGVWDWQEPADSNNVNQLISPFFGSWTIRSDILGNGQPADGHTYVRAGVDPSDSVPFDMTFNDLGDTVPDTGRTCSLFGLSLMGLAFLRRKLC